MSHAPLGCQRCTAYAPLLLVGALWLCQRCAPQAVRTACAATPHAWRGAAGTWVCARCGAQLPLVAPPPPPPAPVPAPIDWWC